MRYPSYIAANLIGQAQSAVAALEAIYNGHTIDPAKAAAFQMQVASAPAVSASTPAPTATLTGLYAGFVALTENLTVHVINIVLLLVIWGLEGHPFVALIGFILNIAASALAGITGLGWRLPAAVFVLLGLAAIVL